MSSVLLAYRRDHEPTTMLVLSETLLEIDNSCSSTSTSTSTSLTGGTRKRYEFDVLTIDRNRAINVSYLANFSTRLNSVSTK